MFLVNRVHFLPGFGMHKVESLYLMLFEQDRQSSFENVNPFLKVDDIEHMIDCLLHLFPLFLFLPFRRAIKEIEKLIADLFEEVLEAEIFDTTFIEKVPSKSELIEDPTKDNHEDKDSQNSLEDTSHKGNSIK